VSGGGEAGRWELEFGEKGTKDEPGAGLYFSRRIVHFPTDEVAEGRLKLNHHEIESQI
jgi:hypothetical protein